MKYYEFISQQISFVKVYNYLLQMFDIMNLCELIRVRVLPSLWSSTSIEGYGFFFSRQPQTFQGILRYTQQTFLTNFRVIN